MERDEEMVRSRVLERMDLTKELTDEQILEVIREEICRFRIISADRQDTDLLQHTGLPVNLKDTNAVVPCIGAEHIIPVSGKSPYAGCTSLGMVFIQS